MNLGLPIRAISLRASVGFYLYKYSCNVSKVKCTLVQKLRLCTDRTVHSGSRGITLLFLDHVTRRGCGLSVTPRPLFTRGKDPVPIVQEAVWAPWSVWAGAENLAHPPGFDPRTVQPVASRYTDYATRPTNTRILLDKSVCKRAISPCRKYNVLPKQFIIHFQAQYLSFK